MEGYPAIIFYSFSLRGSLGNSWILSMSDFLQEECLFCSASSLCLTAGGCKFLQSLIVLTTFRLYHHGLVPATHKWVEQRMYWVSSPEGSFHILSNNWRRADIRQELSVWGLLAFSTLLGCSNWINIWEYERQTDHLCSAFFYACHSTSALWWYCHHQWSSV